MAVAIFVLSCWLAASASAFADAKGIDDVSGHATHGERDDSVSFFEKLFPSNSKVCDKLANNSRGWLR